MLVLGGKGSEGHVLHLIVGPESDFHLDVHGVGVLDITPLLLAMNGTARVQLQLTRCKSEIVTSKCMQATGVPHLNSFEITEEPEAKPGRAKRRDPGAIVPAGSVGRCSYCGVQDVELLPIPGIKICGACAHLELSRIRVAQEAKVVEGE